MNTIKTAILSLLLTASLCANATVIDFSSETIGAKANGYTVQGVQFFDTIGANLEVNTFGVQSQGKGLAVRGDDPSQLRVFMGGIFNAFALDFGNDDPSVARAGDLASLQLFLNGVQVGQTTVLLNLNDVLDQTISIVGINFDEALFGYVNANLQGLKLIEVVDNITFSRGNEVPEPGVLALLGLGFASLLINRRRFVE